MSRIPYLDKALGFSPVILKRMIQALNPAQYDERIGHDRFTIREVAAHLADFEPIIRGRMELARTNSGAEVSSWDEDQEAISKNYAIWDVATSLETFLKERLLTQALFESLSESELEQTIKHPVMGERSIFELGVFCLGHDSYHLEQISEYLST